MDGQSILQCALCSKTFSKESTARRHWYYCRSKVGAKVSRPRSCYSCVRRKARCDEERPSCGRCTSRNIDCAYPTNTTQGVGRDSRIRRGNSRLHTRASPSLATDLTSAANDLGGQEDEMHLVATSAAPRSESGCLGVVESDWDDFAIDSNSSSGPLSNEMVRQNSLMLDPSTSAVYSTNAPLMRQRSHSTPENSPQPILVSTHLACTPQLFIQRPKMTTGGQRTANLISYTLQSYSQRLLHQNDIPPFIHPYSLSATGGRETRISSLNTCISLLHVLHCGVPGSPALFWRNVQCECERLRNEALSMNKWELLAALQALAIYIIERLNTHGTCHETLDPLLIRTVTDLAQQSSAVDINVDLDPERLWCDWVFNESSHRVIDMLVHFEPAAMCPFYNTSLVLAPLPARKQLWKADNASTWRRERERGVGAQTSFALFANGELVDMAQAPSRVRDWRRDAELLNAESKPGNTANWNEWCSGMDEFGSLVMLAASSIEICSPSA